VIWSSPLSLAAKLPIIAWLDGDRWLRRQAPGAAAARLVDVRWGRCSALRGRKTRRHLVQGRYW
jgi:hypothetical protein